MLPGNSRARGGKSAYARAAALTVVAVAGMAAVVTVDAGLAGRLVSEHGLVEWLQVVLLAGAGLISARFAALEWAAHRSGAADVVLTAGLAFLAISEMEVPRGFLGKSIKIDRLARAVGAGHPRETMLVLVIAGLVVAVGIYALRHRAELIAWGRSALRTSWGRLLLLGIGILVVTEVFERSLNRMLGAGLPRPLLEETLELLAALYCLLAVWFRRRDRAAAGGRVGRPGPSP
jgi:hypothetical protein